LPDDKQARKELKVTDKRIFTPEGEIREEFQKDVPPASAEAPKAEARPEAKPDPKPDPKPEPRPQESQRPPGEERRRSVADKASNPETPFTNFIEPLIAQAYMLLGLLRNPYQPEAKIDPAGARQMIEILTLLKEKTRGNLDPDEADFPYTDTVTFVDMESGERLTTEPWEIAKRYRERLESWREHYRRHCREARIDYVPLDTRTPFDRALLAYLEKRARLM